MPVTTVPADQISWIKGRPVVAPKPNANTNTATTTKKPTHKNPKTTPKPSTRRVKHHRCRALQLTPQLALVTPGSPVAVDCEGVELIQETGKRRSGVGRLSIVNVDGQVVYDTFVSYPADVPHRPPPQRLRLGVTHKDILPENGAQPHAQVLANARAIFDKSGVIVAHAASNDIRMLHGIDFANYTVHDTQRLYGASLGRSPGLGALSSEVLGRSIQVGEHSSVEDARATMELFLRRCEMEESESDYAGETFDSDGTSTSAEGETDGGCDSLTDEVGVLRLTSVVDCL